MEMITERRRLLGLQHQLNKRLTALMPNTVERKLLVPGINKKVIVNYNSKLMKWFFYVDNTKEQKFTFFVGNWKYGANPVSNTGSIKSSWPLSTILFCSDSLTSKSFIFEGTIYKNIYSFY